MTKSNRKRRNGLPVALTIWSSLLLLAAFLGIRRAVEGFLMPESSVAACSAAIFAAGTHLLAAFLCSGHPPTEMKKNWLQATCLGAFCFPLALASPLFPDDSAFAIMSILATGTVLAGGLIVLTAPQMIPINVLHSFDQPAAKLTPSKRAGTPQIHAPHQSPSVQSSTKQTFKDVETSANTRSSITGHPFQQLKRVTFDDGTEQVQGVFHIRFAANQKQATTHIPFSPPLATLEDFELGPIEVAGIRLKPSLIKTYGIRLEAHRSQKTDQDLDLSVTFTAIGRSLHQKAA